MTRVCPHCRAWEELDRFEPSPARCPACGGLLASFQATSHVPGEARIFDEEPADLGIPLDDGSAGCPVAFGRYRVLGLIGKGGMGLVYRARDEESGREIAIKTVRVKKRGMLHRIRREIHALARIHHPGLVQIIETGQVEGLPWYAMELLQGQNLQDRLEVIRRNRGTPSTEVRMVRPSQGETRDDFILALDPDPKSLPLDRLSEGATVTIELEETPLARDAATLDDLPIDSKDPTLGDLLSPSVEPEETSRSESARSVPEALPRETAGPPLDNDRREFLGLILRLCETLSYLHAEGIVHRDIKPQNIIIRADGSPVLLDFGLASYFGAEGRESLEVGGKVEGTPEYMSPEQVRGEYVDARADLYAVGCILYEGLTGKVPFEAATPGEVIRSHVKTPPVPPRNLCPEIPADLNDLVLRLLAKKAADRIGYASDVVATLERLGFGRPEETRGWPSRDYLYRPGFVGRGPALAELEKQVRRVLRLPGHCLFVRGKSGVGKTRFIMESARQFEQSGLTVVTGECLPIGVDGDEGPSLRATPLHPFRPFLQMVADCCLEGGCEAVGRLLGPSGGVLAACEPELASLPGLPESPSETAGDAEGTLQSRLIEALGQTLEEYARTSPIVLFIDDLQWADALTLHFLALFHIGVWDSPNVAIVASYRSEETDRAIRGYLPVFQDATFIELGPMEEPSLGAIVREMLGSNQADDRFVRHLARRSDGNPFFVAEYLRAAVAEGLLSRDDSGCWRPRLDHPALEAGDLDAAVPLPDSLQELVIRRLSGLTDDAREILERAAIVGRQIDADLLEAVAPLGESRTMSGIESLLFAQVLEESRDGFYRFTHDMLREIAYGQIPADRRRELHRSVAQALESRLSSEEERNRYSTTLAHHWYRSIGDRSRQPQAIEQAIHYLQRSTGQAMQAGMPAEAVDFGRAAARLLGVALPDDPVSIRQALHLELARIDQLLAGRAPGELVDLPPSTVPSVDRSIDLLVSIQPPAFLSNQLDLFALMASRNLSATLEHGLTPLAPSVFALYALVERIVLEDTPTALAYSSAAEELDRRTGGTQTADVLFLKGWFVDHWVAPFRQIMADCDRGARLGMESGQILYGSYNHAACVHFLAASGEPLDRVIVEAEARLDAIGRRVIVARFHCVLERQFARALAGLTTSPEVLTDDRFDESRDLSFICRTTNANQVGFYHVTRLKLDYYRGHPDRALLAAGYAEQAAGSFACQPAQVDLVFFRVLSLLALSPVGPKDLEAARRDLAQLVRWRSGSEANFGHKARLVEAEIARVEGRPEALALYRQAIHSARIAGFPHLAALAAERAARYLIDRNEDAGPLLRQAIDGYQAWGAKILVDRLEALRDGPLRPESGPDDPRPAPFFPSGPHGPAVSWP